MRARLRRVVLAVAALSAALRPEPVRACAVCVGLTKDDWGLLLSALFLMAVPLVVAGVIGGWLYYSYRRSAARRPADAPTPRLTLTEKES